MRVCGVRLLLSRSTHPQTDGVSEIMNRMLENYLQCYCKYHQSDWDDLLASAAFSYNSAVIESMGCSPFELDLVYRPKTPLDFLSSNDSPVESVNEFKSRLRSFYEDAKFAQQLAKARFSAYNAQKYRAPSYRESGEVWLSKKYITDAVSSTQPSRKLSVQRYGPFKVLKLIGQNAVRLDFPPNIRSHTVVHVKHTSRVRHKPDDIGLSGPPHLTPPPDKDGQPLYEVESILCHRKRGKGFKWLTLMRGAPQQEACWQPTRDFIDADGTITEAFHDYIVQHVLLSHLN